eukprot:scaffold530_cov223-Chaetoceros_neogracile.AAC.1
MDLRHVDSHCRILNGFLLWFDGQVHGGARRFGLYRQNGSQEGILCNESRQPLVAPPASLNMPPGVFIPASIDPNLILASPKAMELLHSLSPQQMQDSLREFDDAMRSKGGKVRNITAYLIGVFKCYVNVNCKQRKSGAPIMTEGLQKIVDTGFCTKAEISDPKVEQKIKMLNEHDAVLAVDEFVILLATLPPFSIVIRWVMVGNRGIREGGKLDVMIVVWIMIVIGTVGVLPGIRMMMIDAVIGAGAIAVIVMIIAVLLHLIGTTEDVVVVIDLVPGLVIASMAMVVEEGEIDIVVAVVVGGLVVLGLHLLNAMGAGTHTPTITVSINTVAMPIPNTEVLVILLPMLLLDFTLISSNHHK